MIVINSWSILARSQCEIEFPYAKNEIKNILRGITILKLNWDDDTQQSEYKIDLWMDT